MTTREQMRLSPAPDYLTLIFARFSPLSMIGMPYYTQPLLSLLPSSMDFKPSPNHHRKPLLDPTILSTVKTVDFVGYAPYPAALRATTRRNQVDSSKLNKGRVGLDAPLFRSDQERAELARKRDRAASVSLWNADPGTIQLTCSLSSLKMRRKTTRSTLRCRNITARLRSSTADSVSKISTLASTTRPRIRAWKRISRTRTRILCYKRCITLGRSGRWPSLTRSRRVSKRTACCVRPDFSSECSEMRKA